MNYAELRKESLRLLAEKLKTLPGQLTSLDKGLDSLVRDAYQMPAGRPYGFLRTDAQNQITETAAEMIAAYMEASGYLLDKALGQVNIIYIEGASITGGKIEYNNDKPNEFNDCRLVLQYLNNAPTLSGQWEGTTEPGFKYTDTPMNPKGAARIKFGQYQAWQVGIHGNTTAHEALIQVKELPVHRDANKDMARTGDQIDRGLFGINQHGGYDFPFGNISSASAGCLVGRTMKGHQEFMKLIKSDPRFQSDNKLVFKTTILDGSSIKKWANSRPTTLSAPPKKEQTGMTIPDTSRLDESLDGGSGSLIAIAVGYSEGNRNPDGSFNESYLGHTDPGNQRQNVGSFSWQHGGTPDDADNAQLKKLKALLPRFKKAVSKQSPTDQQSLKLWAIVCDLFTQSEVACVGKGGLLEQIENADTKGKTVKEIIAWRVKAFEDPATGQLDAPGFKNDYSRLYADQKRRTEAVLKVIDSHT